MRTFYKQLLLIIFLLLVASDNGFGWSRLTHSRITYWAWRYSGLSPSVGDSGDSIFTVVWNLDSVQNTLGLKGYDINGFLLTVFAAASGADFNINACDTVHMGESDSAIFFNKSRRPDDFDSPTKAMGALFGHMYIPAGGGFADGMCKFFFNTAVREYKAGRRRIAYSYLAMAAHYLEDVGFPPHNEKNYLDPAADIWQATYHGKIEDWIADSTHWYDNFDATCDSFARAPLPACDPVIAIHTLAWECCWYDQSFKDTSIRDDKSEMITICRTCLHAIVPRVTGLFVAFRQKIH